MYSITLFPYVISESPTISCLLLLIFEFYKNVIKLYLSATSFYDCTTIYLSILCAVNICVVSSSFLLPLQLLPLLLLRTSFSPGTCARVSLRQFFSDLMHIHIIWGSCQNADSHSIDLNEAQNSAFLTSSRWYSCYWLANYTLISKTRIYA